MWEQVLDAAVGPCWLLVHHILEVGLRVVAIELGRPAFAEVIDHSLDLFMPPRRVGPQVGPVCLDDSLIDLR